MPFVNYLIPLVLFCCPVWMSAQQSYYYLESHCDNCSLKSGGQPSRYELISDQVHPFTMGGNERERELIIADYRMAVASTYANYPMLAQEVILHKFPDPKKAEQMRDHQVEMMKRKGYQVLEIPYWLVSHRAIAVIDDYLSCVSKLGFDGVVLIAENDWIVHRRGYGCAREFGDLMNSPNVVFPIGTMSKAFTAQAVLLLQDAGRLRLSDNLGKLFKGIAADKRSITINHLLTHTSGLEREILFEGSETGTEMLDAILNSKLHSIPGERYAYSNAGYQLLALIIQKITRQPYDQFLRDHILRPFQLNRTGFAHYPPPNAAIADGDVAWVPKPFYPISAESYTYLGSDGFLLTIDDLFRWFRSLSRLPFFFEMTRHRLDIKSSHGFAIQNNLVTSQGNTPGYEAHLSYDQSRNRVIILLSNIRSAPSSHFLEAISGNIHKIMDGQYVKKPVAYTLNKELPNGRYVDRGDTLQIFSKNGRIQFSASGQRLKKVLERATKNENTEDPGLIETSSWRGFLLPTAAGELTYYDLSAEEERKLFFSEDLQEIQIENIQLERIGKN